MSGELQRETKCIVAGITGLYLDQERCLSKIQNIKCKALELLGEHEGTIYLVNLIVKASPLSATFYWCNKPVSLYLYFLVDLVVVKHSETILMG